MCFITMISICSNRIMKVISNNFYLYYSKFYSEALTLLIGANGFVDAEMSVDHVDMLKLIANQ